MTAAILTALPAYEFCVMHDDDLFAGGIFPTIKQARLVAKACRAAGKKPRIYRRIKQGSWERVQR